MAGSIWAIISMILTSFSVLLQLEEPPFPANHSAGKRGVRHACEHKINCKGDAPAIFSSAFCSFSTVGLLATITQKHLPSPTGNGSFERPQLHEALRHPSFAPAPRPPPPWRGVCFSDGAVSTRLVAAAGFAATASSAPSSTGGRGGGRGGDDSAAAESVAETAAALCPSPGEARGCDGDRTTVAACTVLADMADMKPDTASGPWRRAAMLQPWPPQFASYPGRKGGPAAGTPAAKSWLRSRCGAADEAPPAGGALPAHGGSGSGCGCCCGSGCCAMTRSPNGLPSRLLALDRSRSTPAAIELIKAVRSAPVGTAVRPSSETCSVGAVPAAAAGGAGTKGRATGGAPTRSAELPEPRGSPASTNSLARRAAAACCASASSTCNAMIRHRAQVPAPLQEHLRKSRC